MRRALTLHPDGRCAAAAGIEAEARRPRPGRLEIVYRLRGRAAGLLLPPPAAPAFAEGLWRSTCFEAFVRAPGAAGYLEFNFAPSTRWAAYRFDAYRQGMAPVEALAAPRIRPAADERGFELQVALELGGAPELAADRPWRIGLSAVIEEAAGGVSHWALAHPPGRPDFHHPDCFALELPPRGGG